MNENENDDNFHGLKVKGEMDNYIHTEGINHQINLKSLIKVQSCVRRFLKISKFLKEHKSNQSVFYLFFK